MKTGDRRSRLARNRVMKTAKWRVVPQSAEESSNGSTCPKCADIVSLTCLLVAVHQGPKILVAKNYVVFQGFQLIQNEDVLELLMMSLDSYVNNDCLCIKSERFGVTTHGAKRSIDCYAYRKHITRDVKITVRNTGDQTKVYLKPATRRDGSSPFDISLFGLVSEYNVLVAKKTCVTLTFASLVNETQECVIWGTRVDDKIEDNDCYNSSLSSCGVLSFALETRHRPNWSCISSSLTYDHMRPVPKYDETTALGNLGGINGMYLGLSFLVLF
ncbi:hypothetical protein MRX96_018025 [Rhipicephalus microplus]